MSLILGLNAYHGDSAACVVRDGEIAAAAEEERFRRIKHWAGFPLEAIRYCLGEAGARLSDLDHVAVNQDSNAHLLRKAAYLIRRRPNIGLVLEKLRSRKARAGVVELLTAAYPGQAFNAKVHAVEHHLAHLASCFLVSPFRDATAVSVDGFGDFSSAAWGVGRGTRIDVEGRVYFPHSLGVFYQALTQYLGFPHYGDEYKVMGLAPYGEPRFIAEMRRIVKLMPDGGYELDLAYFRHHRHGDTVPFQWAEGQPTFGGLFSAALEDLVGPRRAPKEPLDPRHRDLARSVQAMYEEAFFHLLNALHARHRLESITLAGGCGMNSVANGKIRRMTPYKRVYVQSAAGDAGGAIGAAMHVWHQIAGQRQSIGNGYWSALEGDELNNRTVMDHAYFGPSFSVGFLPFIVRNVRPRPCAPVPCPFVCVYGPSDVQADRAMPRGPPRSGTQLVRSPRAGRMCALIAASVVSTDFLCSLNHTK